ncbi:hypothetical protein NUU61_007559 [Penicillium alfredii]|uniref:Uncharacterized protein n=1 Tax=Penicillium alfredii TaxID=1506179 RepID=A0A9W9JZ41_9EURO|nr:uncharacterized protein NUU61_007559 [Penicillium alfredii]KAJ5086252.1 hypothetical protein NUU61_007559 [Penicillium alfredii]
MRSKLMDQLHNEVQHLRASDHRLARQCIRSIIVMESQSGCRSILKLPRRLEGFAQLETVNHIFDESDLNALNILMHQSLSRRKAAERFVEILRALEVAVDQLDLGNR